MVPVRGHMASGPEGNDGRMETPGAGRGGGCALRIAHDPGSPDDAALAVQALRHLREQLLSGVSVAVQDGEGRTFIGTPEEAAKHMAQQA